eukprot:c30849_g1_i1 orf=12-644(+)
MDELTDLFLESTTLNTILPQFKNASIPTGSSASLQGSKVCVTCLPDIDSPEELVTFLEARINKGAIAQCRLCTKRDTHKCSGTAIVQFKTPQDASCAIQLARTRKLTFKGSQIKVYPANKRAQKRKNDGLTVVNHTVLHVGCLKQKDVLYKLWTCHEANIEVDNARKRFSIIIHTSSRTIYKLEWLWRDIHELCRCKSRGGHTGQTLMLR